MTLWPVFAFWTLALAGLVGPPAVLLYALFAVLPFAALAVVPVELTGGLTVTGAPVIASLLIAKALRVPGGVRWFAFACTSVHRLGPLFLFWVAAVLTTLFAPHLFGGEVMVIPMRGDDYESVPLAPSLQQFSQLAYVSVSVFAVAAIARLLQSCDLRRHAVRAVLLGALVLSITGLLDDASSTVELKWLLEPFRTASYAIATEAKVLDVRRLSGLTPEPSAFGSLCISYLAALWFFRRLLEPRALASVAAPAAMVCLVWLIYRSTSSTAYVSFALLVCLIVAERSWRLLRSRARTRARLEAWTGNRRLASMAAAVALLFALYPQAQARVVELVDEMVIRKSEGGSYAERTRWTEVSLRAAIDTRGIGVGLGGTRASNSFVAMLSNVGLFGTTCFVLFVAGTYLRRPNRAAPDGERWLRAYRWSVPPIVALGLMAGTTADFGPFLAVLFGSTIALQSGRERERAFARLAPRPRRPARRGFASFLKRRRRRPARRPASASERRVATYRGAGPVPDERTARSRPIPFVVAWPSFTDLGEPGIGGVETDAEPCPEFEVVPAAYLRLG